MQGDTLHPLEIKKSANPHVSDTRSFKVLDNIDGFNRGSGGVICAAESLLPLGAQDRIIPVTYL